MTPRRRYSRKTLVILWPQFDLQRSEEAHGDLSLLRDNPVNVSVPSGSSHFDLLQAIAKAAHRPFPIKSLSEKLKGSVYVRGRTCFGPVGDRIEGIMEGYPSLRWWMETDGLVVGESRDKLDQISRFDRIAGALVIKHWCAGRLPKPSLGDIAEELDRNGFQLQNELQPAQWKPIAAYHQKRRRRAIQTFSHAASDRRFVRGVRRRLYVARERYQKALGTAKPPENHV